MTAQIDSHIVETKNPKTILQAARDLDIPIPTLCHMEGLPHQTSCMICVVQEMTSGKLWPACATVLEAGMVIETHNDFVQQARKDALTLLMSEHVGDCEGPCRMACPAHMDIPQMLRHIQNENWYSAIQVIKEHIPLPATLGRICPAPCEKVCRLSKIAESVAICEMKRIVADRDLNSMNPFIPQILPSTDQSIGIIGAGPCGLSAAYYLRIKGHSVHVYDKNNMAGGSLRIEELSDKLPKDILDQEIDILRKMDVEFNFNRFINKQSFSEIESNHDAILMATGMISNHGQTDMPVPVEKRKIIAPQSTFQIDNSKIFAAGGAIKTIKMAVQAVAHGHDVTESIHQYLSNQKAMGPFREYNSRLKHVAAEDINQLQSSFQKEHSQKRITDPVKESGRCLHCDCLAKQNCRLRELATELGVQNSQIHVSERLPLKIDDKHSKLVFEAGKCIRCGICVQIAKENQSPELTFINRGDAVQVTVPFNDTVIDLSDDLAVRVAKACPTGAFTLKES